jgi:lysyl-tRNA synthetase class I
MDAKLLPLRHLARLRARGLTYDEICTINEMLTGYRPPRDVVLEAIDLLTSGD